MKIRKMSKKRLEREKAKLNEFVPNSKLVETISSGDLSKYEVTFIGKEDGQIEKAIIPSWHNKSDELVEVDFNTWFLINKIKQFKQNNKENK